VHSTFSDVSIRKDKKKSIFSKFKKKKKNKITSSQPNINQLENLTENVNLEDTASFKSESTEPEQRILENSENSNSGHFKLPKLPSSHLPTDSTINPTPNPTPDDPSDDPNFNPSSTWIHELFGGTLVNETRCLTCHSISSKEEKFLDLSVDIEADSSLSHCLQTFCTTETLTGDQKYFCEHCGCKVEAHKRMRIKSLPKILCVQLKRFKFQESLGNFVKLSSRVTFPEQLRVDDLMQKSENGKNVEMDEGELDGKSSELHDPMYQLVSSVIHCGQGKLNMINIKKKLVLCSRVFCVLDFFRVLDFFSIFQTFFMF
jgi:ubiquitin carboxyl-terminal hydrolase 12/46